MMTLIAVQVVISALLLVLWLRKHGECIVLRRRLRRREIALDTVKNQNARMIAVLAKMQAGKRRPK